MARKNADTPERGDVVLEPVDAEASNAAELSRADATRPTAEVPPQDLLDHAAATSGAEVTTGEPVPLEVPLEEQITTLPPLVYPGSKNEEFDRWAADKRHNRVRLEVVGAAVLLLAGVAASAISGRTAFAVVAVFGIAGLAVYEFLVTSFE